MNQKQRQHPLRILPLLALLLAQSGCALVHHKNPATAEISHIPPGAKPWHFSLSLPFFHHKPPPPRAQALQRVGVIRTLSADGTFVIIELEPGVWIPPGRDLIVTATGGEPIHLQSAESQPPYFIADIKNGQPIPGQIVFQ